MLRRAGLRIAYVFLPDLGEEVYGFFTDFLRGEREQAYGLLTDSDRIWEIRKKSVSHLCKNP